MKKIVSLLVVWAISVSLFAQSTNYSQYKLSQNDAVSVKAAKTCMALLKRWNEGINSHSAYEASSCFGQVAFYYTDCFERSEIAKSLNSSFSKYPQYKQTLTSIKVDVVNDNHVEIYFNKNVKTAPNAQVKSYPSYLIFDYYDGSANIKKESDKVTDANIAKKAKNVVRVTNKMSLSALFCPANVNKYVDTGYWELVGFDADAKVGPIAAAISNATDFARSTMFGTIHKGYKGNPNTYYVGGHCAGGQSGWYVIYVYDSRTKRLSVIGGA